MKGHRLNDTDKKYALALSAHGWTDSEVAALTGINRHTVKSFRHQTGLMRWRIKHVQRCSKKHVQRFGVGLGDDCGGEPAEATDTWPGSDARIEVLAARAAAGVDLWHPADFGFEEIG